jgi:hypothetical protein
MIGKASRHTSLLMLHDMKGMEADLTVNMKGMEAYVNANPVKHER